MCFCFLALLLALLLYTTPFHIEQVFVGFLSFIQKIIIIYIATFVNALWDVNIWFYNPYSKHGIILSESDSIYLNIVGYL